MNAPVTGGAAGFLARYDALRGMLPSDPEIRDAAAQSFRDNGLPGAERGRRAEAWKYTSLRPVADARFGVSVDPAADVSALLARVPDMDTPIAVFVDGRLRGDLSKLPAGFVRFADQPDFGTLTWPDRDPMVALNTMLAEDGAQIVLDPGQDGGVLRLVSIGTGAASFHPRHMIRLGAGARLTVLEIALGTGTYLHNPVTEAHLAQDAHLTHVRLQDEAPGAFHLATIEAEVAEGAIYDGFSLVIGGRICRTELHAALAGPNATAHLNGAQLLAGTQHGDFTSIVRHAEPSGTSRQTVKNVMTGRARGVFQGRIEVARGAQKTDGYQMNQALLLSPDAEIDTKPELEIFADDVKCSHGATVGELDADQLFYLRSRGVPDAEARAILIRAFLAEALEAVADEAIRAILDTAVQGWWERQAA